MPVFPVEREKCLMAQDLQHLIDRIQSEAVAKAQQQADDILSQARQQAQDLVKKAEQDAETLLAGAKEDAQRYTERSVRTLEQVSRDLLISVGTGVQRIFDDLVRESLDEALDIGVIKSMLEHMAEAYMSRGGKQRRIAVLVNPEDEKALLDFYTERYRNKLRDSIEILPDGSISKGFQVSLVDEHAQHDFSKEAIAEAMSKFLRPHLSEIVLRVAQEDRKSQPPDSETDNV
jgi:V/A-type H+/Na+-transporting ATPase subunit E